MVETLIFPTTNALPPVIKQQILDFLRINYPEGFRGGNRLRDWTSTSENHPAHIVIVEHERLISHTEILWKWLAHNGFTYKAYGLSGVLTYPEFRGQGYGMQIVRAGTNYIKASDADLGMFNCHPSLKGFYYTSTDWIAMETSVTLVGDRQHPLPSDELLMMLFLTERAKSHRGDFESIPIYFGEDTW